MQEEEIIYEDLQVIDQEVPVIEVSDEQEEEMVYEDLQVVDVQSDVAIQENTPFIEVTDVEVIDIEMSEAFPASGEDDALNHALLNHRELNDAHPITAITGLREELNSIEALQTIYSDKKGNADYYEWADGHAIGENGVGYFVTLNKEARTISICTGDDIFGVVVDSAAFVGGQDDIARDEHYGLVATSGVAPVRCELDVVEGDYVVSNAYGVATTVSSKRGYKVVALHNINGVPYATIKLNITADQINLIGAELQELDSRMDAAEANIISAVNVANQAYQKASEVDTSNKIMSDKVDGALGTVDKLEGEVTNLGAQVSNSTLISSQAKAIAESAATSAESMRNEAVEKANEALVENTELRKEMEKQAIDMQVGLENAALELQATKEELQGACEDLQNNIDEVSEELNGAKKDLIDTCDELQNNIDNIASGLEDTKNNLNDTRDEFSQSIGEVEEDITSLVQEVEPLATWSNGTQSGTAGFVARADSDSTTLAGLVIWQDETNTSIAGFKQEVSDTYATIESVTSLKSETSEAIAGVKQEVADTYATVESVTSLEAETSEAIAGVKQEASQTYATIESVTSLETETSTAIAGITQAVDENKASIKNVTTWQNNFSIGGKNLACDKFITHSGVTVNNTINNGSKKGWNITKNAGYHGTRISQEILKSKETYTLSYFFQGTSGTLKNIGGHSADFIFSKIILDGVQMPSLSAYGNGIPLDEDGSTDKPFKEHYIILTFVVNPEVLSDENIYIQPNRGVDMVITYDLWNIKLERGNQVMDWTPAPEDMAESIASVEQKADANEANITLLTAWKDETTTSITEIEATTNANEAALSAVASYEKDGKTGFAGLVAQVDENKSSISALAGFDDNLAGLQAQVDENTASVETLTSWKSDVGDEVSSITSIKQQADANKTSIESITAWQGTANTSIAAVIQKANVNESSISSLASWKSEVESDISSIASIKQTASANEACIEQLTQKDTELNTTIAGVKATADTNKASIEQITSWKNETNTALAGITATANANSASINTLAQYSNSDSGNSGIAGLVADVNDNTSELSAIVNHEFTKNDGTTVTGLAGLNTYIKENESNVSLVSNRVAGKYVVMPEWVDKNRDTSKIYAFKEDGTRKYAYCVGGNSWTRTSSWAALQNNSKVDTNHVYYIVVDKVYRYYEAGWKETADAYTAGLPASIAGIQVVTDATSSSINSLTSWQGDTNTSMARIEQKADANGAYIQSTVSNMDKYSVGPHSQAYGFTLEQAASVLEEGMIYVPTVSVTEEYEYTDVDKAVQKYTRSFTPQYLYKWGKVSDQYRWITIDKNYTETSEVNTSSKAVYFTTTEPTVSGNFGYWYTNGANVTSPYEAYTLYKWESYVDESNATQYHWVVVATLAGNSQSRAVSQVRQDTNSIVAEVVDAYGSVAGFGAWLSDTASEVQSITSWKTDPGGSQYNLANIKQTADNAGASIAQVVESVGEDGKVTAASIVTAVNDAGSSVVIEADHINLNGYVTMTDLSTLGSTTIHGANIATRTITADQIDVNNLLVNETFSVSIQGSIDSAIDNIEIGGRNLLLNTGGNKDITLVGSSARVIGLDSYSVENGVLTLNANTSINEIYYRFMNPGAIALYTLEAGSTYTFSGKVKVTTSATTATSGGSLISLNVRSQANATDSEFSHYWTGGINTPIATADTTDWVYFAETFAVEENAVGYYLSFQLYYDNYYKGTIQFSELKLEKGNKATSWTPAPEDVVSAGGRNLIAKSDYSLTVDGKNTAPIAIDKNSKSGFGFVCAGGTTNYDIFCHSEDLDLETDTEYTVSFTAWLETTDTTARQKLTWDLWPDTLPQKFLEVTSVPERYHWTVSSQHTDMTNARFRVFTYEADAEGYYAKYPIYVTDIKIERGNSVTDWTPAPEDMVGRDNVITCINASSEGVTIRGDKISVDGTTTFKSWSDTINGLTTNKDGQTVINGGKIDATSLTLSADNIDSGTYSKAINVADKFIVDTNGNVVARDVDATGGTIGGWHIEEDMLYSGTELMGHVGLCSSSLSSLSYEDIFEIEKNDDDKTCEITKLKLHLSQVNIPFKIGEYSVTSIGDKAFAYQANITSVVIPDSVTSIGKEAFWNCSGLETVYIPDSVSTMGANAFSCGMTTDDLSICMIYCEATPQPSSWDSTWNNSERPVTWGYVLTSIFSSIVNPNTTSNARIFAGSAFKKPTGPILPNFLVLEDGSLYANAASINGTVNATEGHFGALSIYKGLITSKDGGLTLDSNSREVMTKKVSATEELGSPKVKTSIISGMNEMTSLDLDDSETPSEKVEVHAGSTIIKEGTFDYGIPIQLGLTIITPEEVRDEGQVQIGVSLYFKDPSTGILHKRTPLQSRTFRVTVWYTNNINISHYVTFEPGASSKSFTVPHLIQRGYKVETFDSVSYYVGDFIQPSASVVNKITCNGNFVSGKNGETTYTLGTQDSRWKEIWCVQSDLNSLSDRNEKNSIEAIPDQYGTFFDELQPVRYKFNVNDSNRYHIGFISQDVRDALQKTNISTSDFAGYIEYDKNDGSKGYGLRYGEFIALCVNEIQKLKKRVEELENKLETMQND